jgi:hypothetical protein
VLEVVDTTTAGFGDIVIIDGPFPILLIIEPIRESRPELMTRPRLFGVAPALWASDHRRRREQTAPG